MPATLTPSPKRELGDKLKTIDADLARLRTERADLARERDVAKAEFTAVPGYDTVAGEFKAGERSMLAFAAKDAEIEKSQQAEVGILRLLGQAQDAGGGA